MKKLNKKLLIKKIFKGSNFINASYFNNKLNSSEFTSEIF